MAICVACDGCRNRTYGPVFPACTLAMCCITALPSHPNLPTFAGKEENSNQINWQIHENGTPKTFFKLKIIEKRKISQLGGEVEANPHLR